MRYRLVGCFAFAALLLTWIPLHGQGNEYGWYSEFRAWVRTLPAGERGPDTVAERYRQKLQTEHVDVTEIQRRIVLIRTKRQELENDFWNHFFTVENPTFNTEPNAFLTSVVEGRKPGTALDVGMGEGRNSLYLAKLGWDVTGIDPADQAVAIAQKRAAALNLKLHSVITTDESFDYGRERWDLIVYSWVRTPRSPDKTIDSLKPGGIVVVEGREDWYPRNALLKTFESLHIIRYEAQRARADFFNRAEMPVVRLVAVKPAPK